MRMTRKSEQKKKLYVHDIKKCVLGLKQNNYHFSHCFCGTGCKKCARVA